MNDGLITAIMQGGRTTVGGVAACWAGLTWAYAIATGQWPWEFSLAAWGGGWIGVMWLAQLAAMARPLWLWPGFLVLPFVLAMLYGAVAREWNRWIVAGILASLAGLPGLFVVKGSYDYGEFPATLTLLSLAAASVLFGLAQERGWFVRAWRRAVARSRSGGGGAGGVGEPAEEAVAEGGELRR
ncbi:MAG: hypothetical protein IKQ55_09355 [Kiritimatiellae bacterium]|nr:hypothetical protein [Kiritimatiellia bacterium]